MLSFSISRRQSHRATRHPRGPCRQSPLEELEARQLLSSLFTVTNANDGGTGSLRQAILSSNAAIGPATNSIDFKIGNAGAYAILLKSALPPIAQPVVIDGTSEPGTGTAPRIELVGTNPGALAVGLDLTASNSTIKGLSIVDFTSDGVQINSASGDLIADNYIGLTAAGQQASNDGNGVIIQGGSSNNTVGGTAAVAGNVISGNDGNGVEITDSSTRNLIQRNFIGTNAAGTVAMRNELNGVLITGTLSDNSSTSSNTNPSDNNTVGGGNLISGNFQNGVAINDGSSGNLVGGNFIGTNIAGYGAVHNAYDGVLIAGTSSDNNTVGGGNLISGNWRDGVEISSGASDNLVDGDLIGTNLLNNGYTSGLGNEWSGAVIDGPTSTGNTIGGTAKGGGDVISGNWGFGVEVYGSPSNLVEGDWIGTNSSNAYAPNGLSGVMITGGSSTVGNTIGGTVAGSGNVISDNYQYGVVIVGGSSASLVEGNLIGTGVGGNGALPNGWSGVGIGGSYNNTIGGSAKGARNVISGNDLWGLLITNGATGTLVEGNLIGTNISGTAAVPNAWDGVSIQASTTVHNTIGGTAAGAANTISGNTRNGVYLSSGAAGNLVEGNLIGTNAAGTGAVENVLNGVQIDNFASHNTVGGTASGAANTISYNGQSGVYLLGDGVKNPNGIGDNPGNLVEYDVIDHNLLDGVRINASPQDSITLIDCTIQYNASYGIWENNSQTYLFIGTVPTSNNGKVTNPQIYTNN